MHVGNVILASLGSIISSRVAMKIITFKVDSRLVVFKACFDWGIDCCGFGCCVVLGNHEF